ncbi:hypothetical protein Gogos_003802 [Gossypium gossypioides]|uniref:Uncharacterized protein n=1 Tax=Gossypium gossypioides TaxID=34282 RepID=A0A7J9CN33_GOSGO|nr:hypothetical protein [Gossypium gossypioides]
MDDLHELFMAANYLEIESLLNGVAKRVADIIKACKNVEVGSVHIDTYATLDLTHVRWSMCPLVHSFGFVPCAREHPGKCELDL